MAADANLLEPWSAKGQYHLDQLVNNAILEFFVLLSNSGDDPSQIVMLDCAM
jgi:hypothetical protein